MFNDGISEDITPFCLAINFRRFPKNQLLGSNGWFFPWAEGDLKSAAKLVIFAMFHMRILPSPHETWVSKFGIPHGIA